MYTRDLVDQDSRWKTCIDINEEYSTNLNFLSLLQIKESIHSTWKKSYKKTIQTLWIAHYMFLIYYLLQNQFFNKILYNVICN